MKMTSILAAAAIAVAGPALAASHLSLPGQLAWTAYGTGSAGYNQSVAIGAALQEATGTNLRVLPGKNDVARTEPLRQGKVDFSATGVGGSFMAQEGVLLAVQLLNLPQGVGQRGHLPGEFFAQGGQGQVRIHPLEQLRGLEGFGHVVHSAELEALHNAFGFDLGCQENDRYL